MYRINSFCAHAYSSNAWRFVFAAVDVRIPHSKIRSNQTNRPCAFRKYPAAAKRANEWSKRQMKFGIFYELQLPLPCTESDEHKLYQNALSQVEFADKLGYDYAWEVEHHFLEEYSHSPSPESFLAAASQRTRQIHLGHGIRQPTTNHPAGVADRGACRVTLSSARCDFGMV